MSKSYFIQSIVFLSCILSFLEVKGQLQLVSNTHPFTQELSNQRTSRGVTHVLPFFEDFSTSTSFPDDQKWENGGVYITNQMAINPPSLNTAIFDGVDATGNPYNFENAFATGFADSLTSCNIDLSSYTIADNIFLSFFWQLKGLGEFPDSEDFLQVQFKDNTGAWETVWTKQGGPFEILESGDTLFNDSEVFEQTLIPISDPKYFHDEFQLSFQTFSKLSGAYDTWLVDYIYINTNRSINDTFYEDATTLQTSPSLLQNYTSVPITHFQSNPTSFLRDEIDIVIKNLDSQFKNISYTVTLKDNVSNTNLGTLQEVLTPFPINGISASVPDNNLTSFTIPVNAAFIPNDTSPKALQYELTFNANEGVGVDPIGLDLEINNSISNVTILDNYYAYDDGTAEYAAGINQRLGRVAVRYIIQQPDTLTEIQMNIPRLETNLSGESIVLLVLNELNSEATSLLYAESESIRYSENRDDFISFELDCPIAVQDTFYIAWQQTSEEQFNVGFDLNNDNSEHIFFSRNGGIDWETTNLAGSLLFRPVFGDVGECPITAIENEINSEIKVYPNPNSGAFNIEGQGIEKITLLNMQGQRIQDMTFPNPQNYINLNFPEIPAGVYLLLIHQQSGEVTTKRIVIR